MILVLPGQVLHLEPWGTHGDAQAFDFGTSLPGIPSLFDRTNDRLAFEFGIEDPLTTHIEVVAVDQCELAHGRRE